MLPLSRLFSVMLTSDSYRQPFLSDYTKYKEHLNKNAIHIRYADRF